MKSEIEETSQQVESVITYETYDFPIWPIALGFSCAFCSVVCHFILPIKSSSVKKEASRENPQHSQHKLNKRKINNKNEEDKSSYYEENTKNDNPNHFEIRNNDEVIYCKDLGHIDSQYSSPENDSKTDSLALLNNVRKEKSIVNVSLPNLISYEMFPAQSSLNIINNTTSLTSLEHLDWGNSKNLYNMIIENKSISKVRYITL